MRYLIQNTDRQLRNRLLHMTVDEMIVIPMWSRCDSGSANPAASIFNVSDERPGATRAQSDRRKFEMDNYDGGHHDICPHVIHDIDTGHPWDHYGHCPCPDPNDHQRDGT